MDSITEEEKKIVEELKKRTIHDVTPKMLNDDSLFYRFAKARDFNLIEAEAMLRKHISWRKEWQLDTILTDYEPPEVLLKYSTSCFVCFDKEGCIVRTQDFGRIDRKGICNSVSKTEVANYACYCIEKDIALLFENGGNLRKPGFSLIYDLEELTYAKAVDLKALQYLFNTVKILVDNYPEMIKVVTVINAPIYFEWLYAALKRVLPTSVCQKVRVYGEDDWKDTLLEEIDADDLPAYLGGNRTDPDGNPLCETFIQLGRTIPKSYYKERTGKKLCMMSDVEKLTVMPFSKEEVTFDVKEDNFFLEWEFEITKGNIDFSLKFKEETPESLGTLEIMPKQRIDTSFESEKGFFKCEKKGKYTIVFDNSYSWIHSKEVYYRVMKRKSTNNELCISDLTGTS